MNICKATIELLLELLYDKSTKLLQDKQKNQNFAVLQLHFLHTK
jgi:hypothetical protein